MTAKGLLKKVETLQKDTDAIVVHVFDAHKADLVAINNNQLYDGKTRFESDLLPSYFDDPYFKTKAAAIAYSDWKERITPNPKRKLGTPNLFINGYYHASRHVDIFIDKIYYHADYKQNEIEKKYGTGINGLGGEYKILFLQAFISPAFFIKVNEVTGLKSNK